MNIRYTWFEPSKEFNLCYKPLVHILRYLLVNLFVI
uniref:Uncharacterized protein n=1 Tax=Rhizophora mucronata TaxID=61149 RepID=A0A2P2P5K5_RHIMU